MENLPFDCIGNFTNYLSSQGDVYSFLCTCKSFYRCLFSPSHFSCENVVFSASPGQIRQKTPYIRRIKFNIEGWNYTSLTSREVLTCSLMGVYQKYGMIQEKIRDASYDFKYLDNVLELELSFSSKNGGNSRSDCVNIPGYLIQQNDLPCLRKLLVTLSGNFQVRDFFRAFWMSERCLEVFHYVAKEMSETARSGLFVGTLSHGLKELNTSSARNIREIRLDSVKNLSLKDLVDVLSVGKVSVLELKTCGSVFDHFCDLSPSDLSVFHRLVEFSTERCFPTRKTDRKVYENGFKILFQNLPMIETIKTDYPITNEELQLVKTQGLRNLELDIPHRYSLRRSTARRRRDDREIETAMLHDLTLENFYDIEKLNLGLMCLKNMYQRVSSLSKLRKLHFQLNGHFIAKCFSQVPLEELVITLLDCPHLDDDSFKYMKGLKKLVIQRDCDYNFGGRFDNVEQSSMDMGHSLTVPGFLEHLDKLEYLDLGNRQGKLVNDDLFIYLQSKKPNLVLNLCCEMKPLDLNSVGVKKCNVSQQYGREFSCNYQVYCCVHCSKLTKCRQCQLSKTNTDLGTDWRYRRRDYRMIPARDYRRWDYDDRDYDDRSDFDYDAFPGFSDNMTTYQCSDYDLFGPENVDGCLEEKENIALKRDPYSKKDRLEKFGKKKKSKKKKRLKKERLIVKKKKMKKPYRSIRSTLKRQKRKSRRGVSLLIQTDESES